MDIEVKIMGGKTKDRETRSSWNSLSMLAEFPISGVLVAELPPTQGILKKPESCFSE